MGFYWKNVPLEEYMHSGHLACQGCGATVAMRLALKALGPKTMMTIPACCWTIIAGPYPYRALDIPLFHTAFETTAAVAAGMKAGLQMLGQDDVTVVGWAGDGGTYDIGIQALSSAAERNEDIIYILYDNEAYMNTGIQRSSGTPYKAWTSNTPYETPKSEFKKDIDEIIAAHEIPYLATLSIAFPDDFIAKVRKAKEKKGFRFLHILSPCPPGWKYDQSKTIYYARMAVETRIFPLFEVEDGLWRITYYPKEYVPIEEYIKGQGRFKHLTPRDIELYQRWVDYRWDKILSRVKASEELYSKHREVMARSPR